MASLRTDSTYTRGQGIVKVLHLASAVTGDTISYKDPVLAFIPVNTSTADAVTASYSSATQLFTVVVANTPNIDIWILVAGAQ